MAYKLFCGIYHTGQYRFMDYERNAPILLYSPEIGKCIIKIDTG